jgi:hypothetical protein
MSKRSVRELKVETFGAAVITRERLQDGNELSTYRIGSAFSVGALVICLDHFFLLAYGWNVGAATALSRPVDFGKSDR